MMTRKTPRNAMALKRKPMIRFKKSCMFCKDDIAIDYKNTDLLRKFINIKGKIVSRRSSGACARHQRKIAVAVKRARFLAFFPYVD